VHPSERFLHKLRRIKKQGEEIDPEDLRDQVGDAFTSSLPGIPAEMGEELFQHFYDRAVPEGSPFYLAMERLTILGDVVDLMFTDYDDEADPLASEDWEAIRDIVSAYAVDLDMDLVNYVMKRIVSHGEI